MENKKPLYNSLTEWAKAEPKAYGAARKAGLLEKFCELFGWVKQKNISWTLEKCLATAKKYSSIKEWRITEYKAYNIATINGWLDECCKHMPKPNPKWTEDNCFVEALKYSSRREWEKKSCGSYQAARRNKWLDECCEHMSEIKKINGYWTKEKCLEESKKYSSKSEWVKSSSSSYNSATINGWLDECSKHMANPKLKWSEDKCLLEAKKYSNMGEWKEKSNGSYQAAMRNGWLGGCVKDIVKRKLSENEKEEIKYIKKYSGFSNNIIGETYGVSYNTMSRIINAK